MNPIAIVHLLAALVMIGVCWPLARRKVKPNRWYGIRIPEAFKSDARWYEINEYGGRLMIRWALVVAMMAGIGLVLPRPYWLAYVFCALAIMLAGLGIVVALILRYAAKTRKS